MSARRAVFSKFSVGGTNLKIFVDIAALGLIILTGSGIILSIQTLRAGRIRRYNSRQEAEEKLSAV